MKYVFFHLPITILTVTIFTVAFYCQARADWMNVTGAETAPNIAEFTVLDDKVRVTLEISISDLEIFRDLVPDNWVKAPDAGRKPLSERLEHFSQNVLQIIADGTTRLPTKINLIEPRIRKDRISPYAGSVNPMTRQPVPKPPEDKRVLYAELDYQFQGKPKKLSFIPPLDNDGAATTSIGFVTFHKSVPVIDFRYLSARTNLTLDWDDPWYSKFDNVNLKRHHGSALMGFLYIEPREIRQEAIMSLQDLRSWTEIAGENNEKASLEVQKEIKAQAASFFAKRNPLNVDGHLLEPKHIRAEFLKLSSRGVQILDDKVSLDLSGAVIGVILSYPIKKLPQDVDLNWTLFSSRGGSIPTIVFDPAGPFAGNVDAENPKIEWKNFLRTYTEPEVLPVTLGTNQMIQLPLAPIAIFLLSLGVGIMSAPRRTNSRFISGGIIVTGLVIAISVHPYGSVEIRNPFAGPPDQEGATHVVEQVLNNINNAFLEKTPTAREAALAVFISDDQIAKTAPELNRALAIKVAGGGTAWVKSISDLKLSEISSKNDSTGFRAVADWKAKAVGSHFGHAHKRNIKFRALVEMEPSDQNWKLTGLTVLEARSEK